MDDQNERNEVHNPWRDSLENCITGQNYLRAREYRALIEYIDSLLASSQAATLGRADHISIQRREAEYMAADLAAVWRDHPNEKGLRAVLDWLQVALAANPQQIASSPKEQT